MIDNDDFCTNVTLTGDKQYEHEWWLALLQCLIPSFTIYNSTFSLSPSRHEMVNKWHAYYVTDNSDGYGHAENMRW